MTPGEHDIIRTEDGFVVCACGQTFSDNTTDEARARHHRHFTAVTIGLPGLTQARAVLEEKAGNHGDQ